MRRSSGSPREGWEFAHDHGRVDVVTHDDPTVAVGEREMRPDEQRSRAGGNEHRGGRRSPSSATDDAEGVGGTPVLADGYPCEDDHGERSALQKHRNRSQRPEQDADNEDGEGREGRKRGDTGSLRKEMTAHAGGESEQVGDSEQRPAAADRRQ